MEGLATIINYCTHDFRFIDECIRNAKKFSEQIIIPVCDHFFNGEKEDRALLEHTYSSHPDCEFIEFAYLPDRLYSLYHSMGPEDPNWSMFWGATPRYIGYHYLKPHIEHVLFLDADEVVEPEPFLKWLGSSEAKECEAYRFASYYYVLKATMRAKNVVNLPLFVRKEAFSPLLFFNDLDRLGAFQSFLGSKKERIVGLHGLPFVHHYSWVRTKEECLHKAKTWGHRHDEDWEDLIEKAFQGETKRLFGTTHQFYEIQDPYFDPMATKLPQKMKKEEMGHIVRIGEKELRRKEIEYALF